MHDVVWDYRCPLDEVLSNGWMTMFPARSQMRHWILVFSCVASGSEMLGLPSVGEWARFGLVLLLAWCCLYLASVAWCCLSFLHWLITGTFPDIYAYYLDRRIAIHYLYYIDPSLSIQTSQDLLPNRVAEYMCPRVAMFVSAVTAGEVGFVIFMFLVWRCFLWVGLRKSLINTAKLQPRGATTAMIFLTSG
ncbi:hypothetical protein CPB85DRAFT_795734 [Mucidula mucida]|nr:hypothetical protein CPB85DRAFT_795734 [Mucidula mucida]